MNTQNGGSLARMTCQAASRLISEAMERELTRRERWALGFHKFVCRSCCRFAKQVTFLNEAVTYMPAQLQKELFVRTAKLSTVRREKIKRLLADAAASE